MIATWLGMQVGFAFAAATKASTVLKPFAGGVTSTFGKLPSGIIAEKSRTGS